MSDTKPRTCIFYLQAMAALPAPSRRRPGQTRITLPSAEVQRAALDATAASNGWTVVNVLADDSLTGIPEFRRLVQAVEQKEADVVAVYSVTVLGRSLNELIAFLRAVQQAGMGLVMIAERINTMTPAGAAIFQFLEILGKYAHQIASQRTRAGLHQRKLEGRPLGRARIEAKREEAVRKELALGAGVLTASRRTGVPPSSVERIRRRWLAEIKGAARAPLPATETAP